MLRLFSLLLFATTIYAQLTETDRVNAVIGTNSQGCVLNLDFRVDPTQSVGGTINWQWLQTDTRDTTADQELHQGLARFNGATTSYINLNQLTGANSAGQQLGTFGGRGYGHGLTPARPGVSYEMVVKFDAISNWAKPFDFGTGPGIDEMTWTWDGDSDGIGRFLIEQYVNASTVPVDFDKAAMEFFRPNLNEWYHLVQVQVPDNPNENIASVWYLYINGYKIKLADSIRANAALTPLQSANYPQRLTRTAQYLARSQWSADPYMQMTVDAIRVYDYALNDNEIEQLADIYGTRSNRYVPLTPTANVPLPSSSEEAKWRIPALNNWEPVYHLDFANNPTTAVGGTINWEWLPEDTSDTAEDRARHRGLARFNGGSNHFIDLMQATGPQSSGKVIPTLFTDSAGSVNDESYGWTIEMVVKPLAIQTWSKYYCLGSGPYYDAIYTGWIGGDNLWEAASYNNIRDQLRPFNPGQLTFYRAPTLNKWTHLTWVLKPQNRGTGWPLQNFAAVWELYVDGQRVSRSTTTTNYPLPLVRRQSYLALSNWNADAPARMVVDAFRVWNYALNADQVEALSDSYGISPLDGGDWAWNQAQSRGGYRAPVYNLDFQTNPAQNTGQTPVSWTWSEQDTTDSTVVAGQHTGLAIFNGTANAWIDLTASSGQNRVPDGNVLPSVIGGPTTPGGSNAPGWSFEIIFKATGWRGWSKLFVISNGADRDETIMGFDGSSDGGANNMIVQNYIDDAASPWNYAATEIVKPIVMNRWYHIILTMKPGSVEGSGNWQVYVNGQLQNWADRLLPLHTFVEIQGASYPRGVPRPNSYLGRSTWNDPTSQIVIDAFRVYDYIVTAEQADAYALAYGTRQVVPVPSPSQNQPIPSTAETSNWQAAGLPTAPIFNAVFSQNPATYVGGRTDYQWLEVDPSDNADLQQRHRGMIVFNGSDPCFADLNLATGPKSIGLIMPVIGGPGSGQGAAKGMTVEMVVKLTAVETWAKLIQMGSGPELDSFVIGWNNDRYNTIEVHNFNRIRPGLQRIGAVDLISQPPLNQWLFITLVMQLTDENTYAGNWVAYESGQVIARKTSTDAVNAANFPMPLFRQYNYLAKSQWNDPTATMLVDMVRVYDYALTEAQVHESVSQYGMYGTTRPPAPITNVTLPWDPTPESIAVAAAVRREPVFNAWFPVNPSTKVVSSTGLDYVWLDRDPSDSPSDQDRHRGLVQLTGDSNNYIDVTTNAGPNSAGVVLPVIGGRGWGTGDSAGWTFELVFKVTAMTSWCKIFNFGNGPEINNIILGVDGTDSSTMAFEMFDRTNEAWPHGFAEVFQPELNRWYHIVVEVAPTANTTAGSGVWYFWVNGRKLAYTDALWKGTSFTPIQGASYPKAVYRRNSYIGKSNWNDPTFRGVLDAFRIYDYRLSQTEIDALATYYGLLNDAYTLPTPAENLAVNPSSQPEVTAWNHDSIPAPVFNAPFAIDPRRVIGGSDSSFDYTWVANDPDDSTEDRERHKGLIKLNGETQQYIDLAHARGSKSIGLVLPTLFTLNNEAGDRRGWTVEISCKVHREETWSKLLNFATGGNDWMDSYAMTWNGDSGQTNQWAIQNYLNLNPINGQPAELGFANFLRPIQLNKWYHIVHVMQPFGPSDRFAARWKIYIDGTLVHAGDYNMPLPVVRENSYIGASQWGNQDRKSQMTVDAVRIYDRGLTTAQVASLARMYGHLATPGTVPEGVLPPVLPPRDPWSNGGGPVPGADGTPGTDDTSTSSSKLGGGAIAGIVIGAVVGAAILCVVLFCVCAGGSRFGHAGKTSTSDPDKMKGNVGYGQMEASRAGEDEIEMGETSETA